MTDLSEDSIAVNIMNRQYRVTCPTGYETELTEAVAHLNHRLETMAQQDLLYSRDHLAIITALNLSYELLKLRTQTASEAAKAERLAERIKTSCNRFEQLETTSGMSL